MIKLTVIFVNDWEAWNSAMLGIPSNGHPRRVTIDLTEEQIIQLQPRKIGMDGSKAKYETIATTFLERYEERT